MSSAYLSMGAWYILPQLVTGWVQTAYYAIWIRAGEPKPQQGTRQWANDRRRIHMGVILIYLLYTIIEADWQMRTAGDCYRALGVPFDVDDRGLNSRFRRLTVLFHPDKVAPQEREAADTIYVQLKDCKDTLLDPAKRFAYDRFGPDILGWQHCTTIADYVFHGARNFGLYYFGTGLALALMGITGRLRNGAFWRYWALAAMFVLELHLMTRPSAPALLTTVVNPTFNILSKNHGAYLQFQFLAVARKILLSFFIALSQLGPMMFSVDNKQQERQVTAQQLDRLDLLAKTSDQEIARLMQLDLTPFVRDEAAMSELRTTMKRWLVDNTIKAQPGVRDATARALQRRQAAAGL